jgi:hypothetical protein
MGNVAFRVASFVLLSQQLTSCHDRQNSGFIHGSIMGLAVGVCQCGDGLACLIKYANIQYISRNPFSYKPKREDSLSSVRCKKNVMVCTIFS